MSGHPRISIVAATIGAVEALKDQGICRWNYTIRSLHQHAKNSVRAFVQAKIRSPPPESAAAVSEKKAKRLEDPMRKVLELNSWGPSTIRF